MARHEYYDDGGDAMRDDCPRCEYAYLADHGDRQHCGKCGYTEWT